MSQIVPSLDRTGPLGQGPRTGKGRGIGKERRLGRNTGVARRGVGGVAACVCPKCGHSQPHARGVPCIQVNCPTCGTQMRGDFCLPEKKEK